MSVGSGEVVDTFTEVETGKGADALERRPQLAAALKASCRLKCPIHQFDFSLLEEAFKIAALWQ